MIDKPKWGSPTGHAEASSRTDKAQPVTTPDTKAALENLKNHQQQLDADGCMVGVSRQALDEILADYEALTAQPVPQAAGVDLVWEDGKFPMDTTMLFSHAYNFDGLDCCSQRTVTPIGRFMIWPDRITSGDWNVYGEKDGYFVSGLKDEAAAKLEVKQALDATLPSEPVLSEQAALEAIREQFENWLTGEGEWPHLKYKNFGGSYITDEACMKWDAYRAGVKAALQNSAK